MIDEDFALVEFGIAAIEDEIARLKAENERLRETLEWIAPLLEHHAAIASRAGQHDGVVVAAAKVRNALQDTGDSE